MDGKFIMTRLIIVDLVTLVEAMDALKRAWEVWSVQIQTAIDLLPDTT